MTLMPGSKTNRLLLKCPLFMENATSIIQNRNNFATLKHHLVHVSKAVEQPVVTPDLMVSNN